MTWEYLLVSSIRLAKLRTLMGNDDPTFFFIFSAASLAANEGDRYSGWLAGQFSTVRNLSHSGCFLYNIWGTHFIQTTKKSNYYQVFVEVEVKSGAQIAANICGKNANPTKLLLRRIWYSIRKYGVFGIQEYLFTIKIDPCLGMRGGWFTGVFFTL